MVQTFICSYKERAAVPLSPAAWNLEATTVADFVSAWQWSCQNCRIVVRIAELLSESQNCCQNRRFFVLVAELLAELLSESQNCCQNRSIVVRITTLVGRIRLPFLSAGIRRSSGGMAGTWPATIL